jgi:hypothetical protein
MTGNESTGRRARPDRPPPRIFLGIAAACLVLNHLSVVLGPGLQAEALVMGCWMGLLGGWVAVAGRTFDEVWARVNPSNWRTIAFMLITVGAALGTAEAVAWFGYGRHLLN